MKTNLLIKNKFLPSALLIFALFAPAASAQYRIEQVDVSNALYKDFVVGPGKIELEIEPGQSKTALITVTNRMDETREFELDIEDFTGSRNLAETVVLLGDQAGPYSLKDFISFEISSFELKNGERAVIPVTVSIPTDAEPGGLYGSVLIGTTQKTDSGGQSSAIISRLGVLFFIKVPGEISEEGRLVSFGTANGQRFYGDGSVTFRLVYENNGSVHLNPYGQIRIKNLIGREVGAVEVDPWFSLPQSLRSRELNWQKPLMFGVYRAELEINRGYDNIVDSDQVTFLVLPWKIAISTFVAIFLIVVVARFLVSKIQISVKKN